MGGVVMLALSVAFMAMLLTRDAARGWRVAAFVPLLFTLIAFLQVQQKTCIALAGRNQRNLDYGVERVEEGPELRAIKAQARRVVVGALVAAAAMTAVFVLVP
jgi:hypothetical protein